VIRVDYAKGDELVPVRLILKEDKNMKENLLMQFSGIVSEIVRETIPRLVHIGGENIRFRTGVWFDDECIVTTAVSVVEGEKVPFLGNDGTQGEAIVKAFDSVTGIALLAPDTPKKITPWEGAKAELGSFAITVAFPSTEGPEVRLDTIRCVAEEYFQTDGASFPGFSGAVVISPDGKILGIVLVNASGNNGQMIPFDYLTELVNRLKTSGFRKKRFLGVRTQPVKEGLLIFEVLPGSVSESAGLRVGDLLLSLNGHALNEPLSLLNTLQESEGEVELSVNRGGNLMNVKVTPVEKIETVTRLWKQGVHRCR
jgi:S1-C subfamily serine protease